jgi:hypothetical protein
MNIIEDITYLAQVNSRKCYPMRNEDVKKDLPHFEIYRNQSDVLDIKSYGYLGHDNEDRMHLWEYYMKTNILPNIKDNLDIQGFYNIELHDSYTYLNNQKDYTNVMTFAKFKDDAKPILIPDPYMICNWGNVLNTVYDTLPFESKLDKVCFFGTTTGNRNPVNNQRINACVWSLNNQTLCEFKITKVAQMPAESIVTAYGSSVWKEIYLPRHVSLVDQMKYKYNLWMDGNTCKFDVWPTKTNSLILKMNSREMLWYYPLFKAGHEYVEVNDLEKLHETCHYYTANINAAKIITTNANTLAQSLFKPLNHVMYTVKLFEEMACNK